MWIFLYFSIFLLNTTISPLHHKNIYSIFTIRLVNAEGIGGKRKIGETAPSDAAIRQGAAQRIGKTNQEKITE